MQQQVIIYGVSSDELLEALRRMTHEVVRELLHSSSPTEEDQHPYTVVETAKMLSVCRQTVHEYVRTGKLRVSKIGGRSYFMRADIMAALQSEGYQRTPKASRSHGRR
jgi:excisionase family DNA binding protein